MIVLAMATMLVGKPNNIQTEEGYDACIGEIKGATHACCGHGVEKGYVKWN